MGIFFLIVSFFQFKEITYNASNLIPHAGTMLSVDTSTELTSGKKVLTLQLENDTTHYVVSRLVNYLFDNLKYGDSIQLYTKPVPFFGHIVAEPGSSWTSKNPHEVFHLVLTAKKDVLIDFEENKRNARTLAWIFPLIGLLIIGYFFYLRSGKKSRFIMQIGSDE
jgi:hypothetical protein